MLTEEGRWKLEESWHLPSLPGQKYVGQPEGRMMNQQGARKP